MVMYYNPANAPANIDESDVKQAVEKWNQARANITIQYGGLTDAPLSKWQGYKDELNVIAWSIPGQSAPLGNANFSWDECDVQLGSWPYDWEYHQLDNVLTHEVGHCLGLGHSQVPGAMMWFAANVTRVELTRDDVEGLRALYPKAGKWHRTWAAGVGK